MTTDRTKAAPSMFPGELLVFNAAWQRVFSRLRPLSAMADEATDGPAFCALAPCRRHRRCCGDPEVSLYCSQMAPADV